MTADAKLRAQAVLDQLARVRELRRIMRDAPDRLRRDAAIVSYSRTLDSLIDDLLMLDDMGLLGSCLHQLNAETPPQPQ